MNEEVKTMLEIEGDISDPKKMIKRIAASMDIGIDEASIIYRKWRAQRLKDPAITWFDKEDKKLEKLVMKKGDITKEALYYSYVKRKKSVLAIAKQYNVSCLKIHKLLKEYGMPPRHSYIPEESLTEENLRDLYITKKMTASSIAEQLGCSVALVRGRVKKYKLER